MFLKSSERELLNAWKVIYPVLSETIVLHVTGRRRDMIILPWLDQLKLTLYSNRHPFFTITKWSQNIGWVFSHTEQHLFEKLEDFHSILMILDSKSGLRVEMLDFEMKRS